MSKNLLNMSKNSFEGYLRTLLLRNGFAPYSFYHTTHPISGRDGWIVVRKTDTNGPVSDHIVIFQRDGKQHAKVCLNRVVMKIITGYDTADVVRESVKEFERLSYERDMREDEF